MLQYILGDVTANKLQWCVQDMTTLLDNKIIDNVFYLVPDHIKFDSEREVLLHLHDEQTVMSGSIAIQVYSFSRLAWYLLKETGVLSKRALSQVGLGMLVRHILSKHEAQLVMYRGEVKKAGFVQQLTDLFMELRGGFVQEVDLLRFEQHYRASSANHQRQKMIELNLLYQAFNQALIGQYIEKEDLYHHLAKHIQTLDLSRVAVYINGYERFTAQEQQVVLALMQTAHKVAISLPLMEEDLHYKEFRALSAMPMLTYTKLTELAKDHQITCLPLETVESGEGRYCDGMKSVLQYWYDIFQKECAGLKEHALINCVHTHGFASKQREVEAVLNEIVRLVATGQYRYQDFYMLMRQVEDYELLLKAMLTEYQIPYFIDNAESMAYHPLVEYLTALYRIQQKNWQYSDLMRLLRTELLNVGTREEVDLLENELLANGYQGQYWWQHEDEWENQTLRQCITTKLTSFYECFNQSTTMKEAAQHLFAFFETCQVAQLLMQWRDDLLVQGRLEHARQHEQAWEAFVNLLDEFVLVLGEEPFDSDIFFTVLLNGFEQAEYSLVPPSLDQLTISSLDGKRVAPKKIVFILGANAQQFPKTYETTGLLTIEERETLASLLPQTAYLTIDSHYRTKIEPFVAYQVFASATEHLYLSYLQREEPSAYVTLLSSAFQCHWHVVKFGGKRQFLRQVMADIRKNFDEKKPVPPTLKSYIAYIERDDDLQSIFNVLRRGFQYKNQPATLFLAPELYQGQIHLSISQLESYFKDPYSHFLQYGLQLKKRQLLSLQASDVGNVFHDTMDILYRQLSKLQLSLEQLNSQELKEAIDESFQTVFNLPQYKLFNRNQTLLFTRDLISETLQKVISRLAIYARTVGVKTLWTEQTFSTQTSSLLRVPVIHLNNDRQLLLRGKIDRIDSVNNQYLSVVDYKSSAQKFDLTRFYEGLSLQLMTYLYVLEQNKVQLGFVHHESMGAFYYHIANAYEKVDDLMISSEERVHKETTFNGLLTLSEIQIQELQAFDTFYQAKLLKSGQYSKRDTMPVITTQDKTMLFDFLLLKIKEAGNRLLAGDIRLQPLKDEPFIPSLREYRSISLFDATLPENRYRIMPTYDDILSVIKAKVGEKDEYSN